MKKLIILAALAVVLPVNADVLATMRNNAGGFIKLTDIKGACGNGQFVTYATSSGNASMWDCWFSADGDVFVKFDELPMKIFNVGDFTLTPSGIKKRDAL